MTAPTVVGTVPTAEFHACIPDLLQHWKSPDSTPVEFSVPALSYSPPSRSENTVFRVTSQIPDKHASGSEPQFLLALKSGTVHKWLRGEWNAIIELGTIIKGGYDSFGIASWEASAGSDYIGKYYGTTSWVSKVLSDAAIPNKLYIRMRFSRTGAPLTTKGPHSLPHELQQSRTLADRLETILRFLDQPSSESTRFRFDSRDGTCKNLYVHSLVLLEYEYFRDCHASGFIETELQPTEPAESIQKKDLLAKKDSDVKENSDSDKDAASNVDVDSNVDVGLDKDTDVYGDADSDAEWELEEQQEYEHSVDLKFKATIHVKDFSRRTYKAFIQWAQCGALHFAPRRAAYTVYVENCKTSGVEEVLEWHVWAKNHCTTISEFKELKTLTSPKSLYRFADKLDIPALKALCRKQIISDFNVSNVIEEITNFRNHDELLRDAFEYVRVNWDLVVQQKNFVRMVSNFTDSSLEIFHDIALTKLTSKK